MRQLVPIVFAIACCAAQAGDTFPTVEAYAAQRLGKPASQVHLDTANARALEGALVFGFAQAKDDDKRDASVFVALQTSTGVREIASSPVFDFSDPSDSSYIEIVEAQSSRRFSVQMNIRSACGAQRNVYRFAQVEATWVVAGIDISDTTCGKDNAIELDWERSTNFLTGKVILVKYRDERRIGSTTKSVRPARIPLAEFDIFDERFGPR